MIFLVIYFIIINIIGFIIMGIDKRKAKAKAYRIPERTLFTIAILYGSVGVSLGMRKFRHKTQHKSFVYGILLIKFVQVILVIIGLHIYRTNF